MRKLSVIALCALISVSAWSVTVNDLVLINKSWTFTADEYTDNGTNEWSANTLRDDGLEPDRPVVRYFDSNGIFATIVKGSGLSIKYQGMTIRQANSRGGFGEAVVY